MSMSKVLKEIQAAGKMTGEEVKDIIELLYNLQTGVHDMDEEVFRDAIEEAMED